MNLDALLTKLTTTIDFVRNHKSMMLLGFPFLLILLFLTLFITTRNVSKQPPQSIPPTPTLPYSRNTPPQTNNQSATDADANINPYEDPEELQKKETLSDGNIKYTLKSPITSRSNIIIVKDINEAPTFQRSISNPNGPLISLAEYLKAYGQAEQTRQGHSFYGAQAKVFIYGRKGIAFIAYERTDTVLELHTFLPMSVAEYLQKYGDNL
jgi:hypothetical protein